MKNAMQLKAIIKNIAKDKNISAALVLQNYMLERFLERVSLSRYHDNYIIKGGFLIASSSGKTCIDEISVSFFLKDDCGYIETVVICAEHMNLKILCG